MNEQIKGQIDGQTHVNRNSKIFKQKDTQTKAHNRQR